MRKSVYVPTLLFFALSAVGQTFSSGSTGADGALDLTSGDRTVQLPDSGILNYTTVNIPAGKFLNFKNNLANTPVVMLAQGAVTISGVIDVSAPRSRDTSASFKTPGPGGFYGGDPGLPGFGPGGGAVFSPGQWIGPLSLVPNVGGSGGGGGSVPGSCISIGGGGGGAITIASSVSIVAGGNTSTIQATGAPNSNNCNYGTAPGGASGAIRLVSNSINFAASVSASVLRLEAPQGALTYNGFGTAPVLATVNPAIVPSHPPSLSIVSIGGYPVPSYSGSSFSTIDVLLPTQLQDPISVVVQATNVPVGSSVSIAFGGSTNATSTTATLAGTTASSTATVSVSGVNRAAVTYLFVSTSFSASLIAGNLDVNDPHGVSKIELAAAPGEKTRYRFLQKDGMEISLAKVPDDIRRIFGL